MYWQQELETMPREEIEKLQLIKLKELVQRVSLVPHYSKSFNELGITPGDINSLSDLRLLPFTTKQDLRDNYPFGMFAVPQKDIVRVHASSGTTGKPTVVGYTAADIETWSTLMARALMFTGLTQQDVVQVAYGYGLFTGGLGFHYGVERLGATVVPVSGGNTKRQLMLLKDFGVTALACTPSYATYLAEALKEQGAQDIKLKVGIFGAEPWSNSLRKEIERKLGIKAYDIYGLSEIMGPGVSCECVAQAGLHISEDHFIAEIINPETGEPLPYGEKGELVITTLTKVGFPVIRYRTRDITVLHPETCACGRTHVRMDRVTGRTDDMLIVRGVNVFPSQIESVLLEIGNTEPHYQLVVDKKGPLDTLEVWVEVSEALFADKIKGMEGLEHQIHREIENTLGIGVKVKLVEPKTIARSEGKAKRVIDRRELGGK
ncbi:MAG TPA: phenylacetate--CoA ligase [Candidatus Deferrimicrobium sp.]|nr:phenylacetate--CoA ligase [Candidatus Deferrimicrobium sp.]